MVMDEHALRSLVAAVETGSLTAAAKRLGVSQPAISQKMTLLESSFGQVLLVRSRQGARPTAAGQLAYEHAVRVLAGIAEMRTALDTMKGEVSGTLRVTANMLLSQTIMGPIIAELRRRHPQLRIDLKATDMVLDLDADEVDVALRAYGPGTGSGVVRKLGEFEALLVATPGYLDEVGRPAGPEDLGRLSYIQYREDPEEREIALRHRAGLVRAPATPAFSAQHPELVLHAVTSGLGFAKAPRFYVQRQLETGVFEAVLPDYAVPPKPLFLVQAVHLKDTPRARAFIEVLQSTLASVNGYNPARTHPGDIGARRRELHQSGVWQGQG